MAQKLLNILIIALTFIWLTSATVPSEKHSSLNQEQWVDSVMQSLSLEERIGQLFMVAAYSNRNEKHSEEIESLIKKYNLGGLIFFQGGPVRQAILTNRYQSLAKVPLFIAMDAEWGLGMRLDSTMSFPKQMTLGAIEDDKYIYKMGAEIARQCKRLGMQINFAPVIDINSNPNNPVIGMRSFGEDKTLVAQKAVAYMKGMQDNRVMANAKHFPGHGDTGSDSHLTLPVIKHSKERIKDIDLYPFRQLIQDSVQSIMVAHIHIPALDSTPNKATTLSKAVVTDLLKNEMGFKGLVFTDALNMKGVSSFYKPGEVDLLALLAGNDVLLYAENVPVAIKKIQKAIKDKQISEEEVNERVKKILRGKYWTGLNNYHPIEINNLYEDLNNSKAKSIQSDLYEKALTVVNNKKSLIPIRILDTTSLASVSIGLDSGNTFQNMLGKYGVFRHFTIPKAAPAAIYDSIFKEARKYEIVVVGLHKTNAFNTRDYGITENSKKFISNLQQQTKTILSVFGSPYSLKYFTNSDNLICAFEDNDITQKLVPQLIFGGISASGKLPITPHTDIPLKTGLLTNNTLKRIRYGFPENAGINGNTLNKIDSITNKAISDGAMPGCQVMVIKEGSVVFNRSYGYLTYDKTQPVNDQTIYDIASISKVAGTLQAVMFLQERELIDIDKKVAYYLPELKHTNKEDIVIKDVLTHQAGLTPFIPHWKKTLDSTGFNQAFYCSIKSDKFNREVVPGLYCISSIDDSLWKWTIESELLKKPKELVKSKRGKKKYVEAKNYDYVYSDLGFYIMKRIVEKLINQPLEDFMQQNFFDPLGLPTMSYKPLEKFPIDRIAPTEDDKFFRKTLIRGTVHDQGAAMLGGVAGHAGLFCNATDLATLLQMNLQYGYYGGLRYLLPGTVPEFSKRQFTKNRRGLGWDKPEPSGNGPTSDLASNNTFGHTGFTGTAAWVDPDQSLIYVFLSNRVYPDAGNNKLIKQGIRTKIQDVIYKAILDYKE